MSDRPSDSTTTRPFEVGAERLEARERRERGDRLRAGMVVVVVRADGDHRDPGSQDAQQVGEARILRAVMGDLQDLDRLERQAGRDVALCVRRQEDVRLPVARERDDRMLVRVLARKPRVVGPQDPHAQLPDLEYLACVDDDDRDAVSAGRGERLVVVARRRLDARVRHGAHGEPIEDPRRPADVIALRMRQDDRRRATARRAGGAGPRRPPPAGPRPRGLHRRGPRRARNPPARRRGR